MPTGLTQHRPTDFLLLKLLIKTVLMVICIALIALDKVVSSKGLEQES